MKFTWIVEKWDTFLFFIYNFLATVLYYINKIYVPAFRKKNKEVINTYNGEKCFIVLNGPSILKHDLTKLKDKYVFCTNFMFKSIDVVKQIVPDFYCWTDSSVFKKDECDDVLRELFQNCGNIKYFFTDNYLKRYHKINDNVYLTKNKFLPTNYKVHHNIAGKFCAFNNVAFYSISVAMSLGFKEIYLLGLDFEPGGFKHFEEHGKSTDTTLRSDERLRVCTEYKQYSQSHFESYYIQDEAKRCGVKIYNLNEKSYIRSFEFKNYEDVLNEN